MNSVSPGTSQGTQAGYFDDPALLTQAALDLDRQGPGIYITLNPLNPELLARGANRVRTYVKQGEGTNDRDIIGRSFFPIDSMQSDPQVSVPPARNTMPQS